MRVFAILVLAEPKDTEQSLPEPKERYCASEFDMYAET
jgi:hypothetical protein